MSKIKHCCQSVTGPLRNWTKRQWTSATKWITRGDGTTFASGAELKDMFLDALSKGYKVLPMCDCPNFDKEKGCQGYDEPD
jgi:hypothetical protein